MPKTKKMWKGVLNSSYDLSTLPPPPLVALLMGSAELPVVPKVKTQFLEDMEEVRLDEERRTAGAKDGRSEATAKALYRLHK